MDGTIVNKVAQSGLETIDLEKFLPLKGVRGFDLKEYLFMELILKEKDFREKLKEKDWSAYQDEYVAVYCSTDAIIPVWAYMLVTAYLQPYATYIYFGTEEELKKKILIDEIDNIDAKKYAEKRVVIKGCGEVSIPDAAFVAVTQKLRPEVKSIMYGEPCSTVPIYKQPRNLT